MNIAEQLRTIEDNVPKVYQAGYDDGAAVGSDAVLYTTQDLTEEQKTQARENIGAVSTDLFYASTSGFVTPQMYGAKGDGVTDDTSAITNMFNAVGADKKVYFPKGNYLTTSSIVVPNVPDIEMDGMIVAKHNGVALFLGDTVTYTMNKSVKIKLKKFGNVVEDGSIGLQIGAFTRSTFYLAFINGFETNVNLLVTGGNGIFFNTFHLDDLNYSAKCGLYLDGTDGWINDNLFIGGSIGKGKNGAAVTIIHGSQNFFMKNGMEGVGTCVNVITGSTNTFLYSRCEASTTALLLSEGAGHNNVMIPSYIDESGGAVCVNNSLHETSGIVIPGIRSKCRHTAVHQSFDKPLTIGNKVAIPGLKFMESNGTIKYEAPESAVSVTDGTATTAADHRIVFEFDTTKNKRFDFTKRTGVMVNVYTADGKVSLTEENVLQYIKVKSTADGYGGFNRMSDYYRNAAMFYSVEGISVSDDVVKVELIIGDTENTELAILTEYPCNPIVDEVMPVSAIPSNGYIGEKVSVNGVLYTHNGSEWAAFAESGEANSCNFQAVAVQDFYSDRLLAVGSNVITQYCKFMRSDNLIYSAIPSGAVTITNGVMDLSAFNYRACFEFDTTLNKSFAFPSADVAIGIYTESGKVATTADDYKDYITINGNMTTPNYSAYGGSVRVTASDFTVSDVVTKVTITFISSTHNSFDIRTAKVCYPTMDEILTVSALPSNGYIGARVIFDGALHIYNGTEWKVV